MAKFVDLTNQTFGEWTVIERAATLGAVKWICECSCGERKKVRTNTLRAGQSKSCGHSRNELNRKLNTKHSMAYSCEYRIWIGMKQRCYNNTDKDFYKYGNRGITVCDEWLNSFETFYRDMGPRPSKVHSIERKNNNSNYDPDNCKWGTKTEQSRNNRNAKQITFNGKTQCIAEWADELKINKEVLYNRFRAEWSVERALTEEVKCKT